MMHTVFFAVLASSAACTAVVLLLLLLSRLSGTRFSARWRYWAWLFIGLRLAFPIPLSLPDAPVSIMPPALARPVPVQTQGNAGEAILLEPPAAKPLAPTDWIPAVWAVGAASFFLFQAGGYVVFHRRAARWSRPAPPELSALWGRLAAETGLRRTVSVKICPCIHTPVLTGWKRRELFLPEENYTGEEFTLFLRHELVHAKRGDLWFQLLFALARSLHWFNPLVHIAARRAVCDLELSCDEAVLEGAPLAQRKKYGEMMLDMLRRNTKGRAPLTTQFSAGRKEVKQRFLAVLNPSQRKKGTALLCTCLLAGVIFTACIAAAPAVSAGETGQTESSAAASPLASLLERLGLDMKDIGDYSHSAWIYLSRQDPDNPLDPSAWLGGYSIYAERFSGSQILARGDFSEGESRTLTVKLALKAGTADLILKNGDKETVLATGETDGTVSITFAEGRSKLILRGSNANLDLNITLSKAE